MLSLSSITDHITSFLKENGSNNVFVSIGIFNFNFKDMFKDFIVKNGTKTIIKIDMFERFFSSDISRIKMNRGTEIYEYVPITNHIANNDFIERNCSVLSVLPYHDFDTNSYLHNELSKNRPYLFRSSDNILFIPYTKEYSIYTFYTTPDVAIIIIRSVISQFALFNTSFHLMIYSCINFSLLDSRIKSLESRFSILSHDSNTSNTSDKADIPL